MMVSNRVAFIPTMGADPFMVVAFLNQYERVWCDEVSRLFVLQNSIMTDEIRDFTKWRIERSPNTVFETRGNALQHGNALFEMFQASTEEYIVLLEDDAFVMDSGLLDKYFGYVERGEYDFIGQPRGCTNEILMMKMWEVLKVPDAYRHFATFWPCMALGKRSDYLKTSLNFGVFGLPIGAYIKELDWTTPEELRGDTFVWMSLQLRALGLNILSIPIFQREGDVGTDWVHFGSLGSLTHSFITDDNDIPLPFVGMPTAIPNPLSKMNFPDEYAIHRTERKMGVITLFMEKYWDELEFIPEYRETYKKAIDKLIAYWLKPGEVELWARRYKRMLKW